MSSWDSPEQTRTNSLVRTFLGGLESFAGKTGLQLLRHWLANSEDLAGGGINNLQCLLQTSCLICSPGPVSGTVAVVPHGPSKFPSLAWVLRAGDVPLSSCLWKYEIPRRQGRLLDVRVVGWTCWDWLSRSAVESRRTPNYSGRENNNLTTRTECSGRSSESTSLSLLSDLFVGLGRPSEYCWILGGSV